MAAPHQNQKIKGLQICAASSVRFPSATSFLCWCKACSAWNTAGTIPVAWQSTASNPKWGKRLACNVP
ncbi:MAG: hypothetical protein EBQ68_06970, partial [Betaproteobacteria bacterium]|nr:hypothetical protein [Betaproteobacteria bacterium]